MLYISNIYGLGNPVVALESEAVSLTRRAGLTKLTVPVLAARKWQPSLSPFT